MKTHILPNVKFNLPNVKFNLRKLLMTYLYQDNRILFLVRRFLSFVSGIITYADQDQA